MRVLTRYRWLQAPFAAVARKRRAAFAPRPVVAITGSAGKTMTKLLTVAILRTLGPVAETAGMNNGRSAALRVLLRLRGQAAAVIEMGAGFPGLLAPRVQLVKPSIVAITNVHFDHLSAFESQDAIEAEKSALVSEAPEYATAVLNLDDPRVSGMRSLAGNRRVITFGLSSDAELRADELTSCWPDPLAGVLLWRGQRVPFSTRLHGVHWVHCVLAAVGAGLAAGVPLEAAARAIADVEPMRGRLTTVKTPGGIFFLEDWSKGSLASCYPALAVLKEARAARRVAIFGNISDYEGRARHHFPALALEAADHVLFVGPSVPQAMRARTDANAERLRGFDTLLELYRHLVGLLRPGDLVLLKSSHNRTHIVRLALAFTDGNRCWRDRCLITRPCFGCLLRHWPSSPSNDWLRPRGNHG